MNLDRQEFRTTRTRDEVINDTALMLAARDIRKWLLDETTLIPRLNESPNHYYGHTMDGLVLIEYYGTPSKIGTPYGEWSLSGGGCDNKEEQWREAAKQKLGLVLLQDEYYDNNEMSGGTVGPVWGITKDLNGNDLPVPDWRPMGRRVIGQLCVNRWKNDLPPMSAVAAIAGAVRDIQAKSAGIRVEANVYDVCKAGWEKMEPQLDQWWFDDDLPWNKRHQEAKA